MEFKNHILYEVNHINNQWTIEKINDFSLTYSKYAEKNYKNDSLFTSRMLLVRLKIISLLDKHAVEKIPLLKGHRTGINPELFDSLLLPHRIDMEIAHKIKQYFQLRNANAIHPGLIEEKTLSENSFAVTFAKEC